MNAELLKNIIILTQGKANLTSIRKQGYTYSQIAQAIAEAENKGFLEMVDNRLLVTNVPLREAVQTGSFHKDNIIKSLYIDMPFYLRKNRHNWYSRVLRSIPC